MKNLQFLKVIFAIGCLSFSAFVAGEEAAFPQSSSLCGNETDGVYRFHNETQSCYKVGEKGPCGDMMIFYAHPKDDEQGQCDCDLSFRCNRPMIYWPSLDRCFLAYEQGPCPADSWVTFGWNLEPACARNPCTSNFTEFDEFSPNEFWFYFENQCVLTGTQGLCPFSNEKSMFNGFSHHVGPFCSPVTFECKLPEVPSLICVPGQKWHRMTGCGLWDTKPKAPRHFHRHLHHGKHRGHGNGPVRHHHRHMKGFQHNHHHNHEFHRQPWSTPALPPFQQPSDLPPMPQEPLSPVSSPLPPTVASTRSTNQQRPLPQVYDPEREFNGYHSNSHEGQTQRQRNRRRRRRNHNHGDGHRRRHNKQNRMGDEDLDLDVAPNYS